MKTVLKFFLSSLSPLLLLASCATAPSFLPQTGAPVTGSTETIPSTQSVQNPGAPLPVSDPLAKPLAPATWNDSPELKGEPKIVVNTKEQKAYFYKGATLVGTSPVSTGMPGRSTPRGTYKVAEKNFVRYSSAFGVARDKKTHEIVMPDFNTRKDKMPANCYYEPARMAYCLRFYNGYCFHQGYVPGYPASHGCVRIVEDMAPLFYNEAKVGMTLIVK